MLQRSPNIRESIDVCTSDSYVDRTLSISSFPMPATMILHGSPDGDELIFFRI